MDKSIIKLDKDYRKVRYFSQIIALFSSVSIVDIIKMTNKEKYNKFQRDLVKTGGNDCINATLNVGDEFFLENLSGMPLLRAWIAVPEINVVNKVKEFGEVFYRHLPEQGFKIYTGECSNTFNFFILFSPSEKKEIEKLEFKMSEYVKKYPFFTFSSKNISTLDHVDNINNITKNNLEVCKASFSIEACGFGEDIEKSWSSFNRWLSNNTIFKIRKENADIDYKKNMIYAWGQENIIEKKLNQLIDVNHLNLQKNNKIKV